MELKLKGLTLQQKLFCICLIKRIVILFLCSSADNNLLEHKEWQFMISKIVKPLHLKNQALYHP